MSEESDKATAALTAAIEAHAQATGNVPMEQAFLSSFVVVAHWVSVEEDGTEGYSAHYATEHMPKHAVLGMLRIGEQFIEDPDDDD